MNYDKLGRMVKRTEPEGQTVWQYDTAKNGVGKVAKVTAPNSFGKDYFYDKLGRAIEVKTKLSYEHYSVKNQYDEFSRLLKQIRPNNFVIENVYNKNGYLSAIRAPKSQITDYDWDHLKSVLEKSLYAAENAQKKATLFKKKAEQYRRNAKWYQWVGNWLLSFSSYFKDYANQLRDSAKKLEKDALVLENQAKHYKQVAKRYMDYAKSIVAWWQKSRYRYANHPWVHWIDWVVNWIANYYERVSDRYMAVAQDKLNQAQSKRLRADYNNQWADIFDYWGNTLEKLGHRYLEYAQQEITKAETAEKEMKKYQLIADKAKQGNIAHYQAMLTDTENVYFWRAKSRDAAGRLTGNVFGNGLSTEKHYNQATGHLTSIKSGFSYADSIRDLSYEYDEMNNVISRQNNQNGMSENFVYDGLDRLTQSNVSGKIGKIEYNKGINYRYDINGNFTYKSDVGNYTLNLGRQNNHRIHSYGENGLTYDANGNITNFNKILIATLDEMRGVYSCNALKPGCLENYKKRLIKSINWTSFNKPKQFSKNSLKTNFYYGADRSRYLKVQTGGTETIRTVYIGKGYEKITSENKIQHKYFIYADGKLITIFNKTIKQDDNPFDDVGITQPIDETRYLHYDNLGSIDTITNGQGLVVDRMSYQAFGKRRNGNWREDSTSNKNLVIPKLTNRGFTGHEHIDEMGLIHMNGRVYDQDLGRFLSPDPNIQAPFNTQSYNRYSYVLNNPLKYTDPSGYFFDRIAGGLLHFLNEAGDEVSDFVADYGKTIVAMYIAYQTGGLVSGAIGPGWWGAIAGGAAAGAASNGTMVILNGRGNLIESMAEGAIIGGASAGAAYGIGHVAKLEGLQKAYMHGLSQGAISHISGGDFKSGFIGGFVSSTAGGMMKGGNSWGNIAGRTTIATVAGGITAHLGGGKFENGAKSAFFVHLFNSEGKNIAKNWNREKTIFDGDKHNFKGKRYLKLESRSGTAGFDPFRYEARGYPLKVDGSSGATVAGQSWGHYTSSGGFGMGTTRIIDSGSNPYGTHWYIRIPLQPSAHGNSYGHHINIYHSD